MNVKLLPKTNIEVALKKTSELNKRHHLTQLNKLIKSLSITTLNGFKLDLLSKDRIYHIDQIKKVCIDYRLRFLDIKYFKNELPKEALHKISLLENKHQTRLGEFKIMAPSVLFRLKKTDDPLLFVPLGNNYYYLIHKWGNDLHPLRKLMMWPLINVWNLLLTVFAFSWLLTELTPIQLFTRTPDSSTYWMLLFFIFKAVASVVLYFGFALGKNFNPAIWNSRYNKT